MELDSCRLPWSIRVFIRSPNAESYATRRDHQFPIWNRTLCNVFRVEALDRRLCGGFHRATLEAASFATAPRPGRLTERENAESRVPLSLLFLCGPSHRIVFVVGKQRTKQNEVGCQVALDAEQAGGRRGGGGGPPHCPVSRESAECKLLPGAERI